MLMAAAEHDAQLMLRVRAGDGESFTLLAERHRRQVVHFLYRMVGHRGVAEELAQEVFLRVYRSRATYEPTAKFTTWLYRISNNLALNWLRDARREKGQASLDDRSEAAPAIQVPDGGRNAEQRLMGEAKAAEVRRAIEALPENQRAAVLMHKYHELGYAQIAEALDCSVPAVKSLLFRAYETLRTRLAHLS
jgi:RNA polymerase sigma-70 factor (ECF subfamily)